MAALLWANLINMYQPPNCDRSTLEKIVRQSYLPVLSIFEQNKGCSFTLNLPGSTVDLLIRTGFGDVIKKIAALAERGQVEFTMTTNFQSLIPLQADEDTDRQIETHNKICSRYFGIAYKPDGLYSPYLAYSQRVSKTGARLTLKWLAIDESCFKSQQQNGFNSLLMDKTAGGILLMACRREISDSISGSFWINNAPRSASEFLQKALKMTSRDKYVITAVEAQSFGYENSGRDGLLRALYRDNRLKPVSISQLRRHVKRKDFVRAMDGSAVTRDGKSSRNRPFLVWENDRNPIQKSLWKLFKLAVSEVKNAGTRGDPQYLRARDMLDSSSAAVNWAMASCSPWWDPAYPRQVADDLAIAIFVLMASSPRVKEDAIALRVQIYEQIDQFEKSGERKKLQKSFFRANNISYDRFLKSR